MRFTLTNDFHGTSIRLNAEQRGVATYRLTGEQLKRAKRKLCPVKGCTCSGNSGMRGPDNPRVAYDGFECLDLYGKPTKAELYRAEREYQQQLGTYGENNMATDRALIRLRELQELSN